MDNTGWIRQKRRVGGTFNALSAGALWTKRACPRPSERVDKLMENALKRFPQLAHTHAPFDHRAPDMVSRKLKTPAGQ